MLTLTFQKKKKKEIKKRTHLHTCGRYRCHVQNSILTVSQVQLFETRRRRVACRHGRHRRAQARRGCRRHVPAPPSSATTLSMMYHYRPISCGGTPALVGHCRPVVACKAVSTIDIAARARWRRHHLRQACLRCTSTRCRHSAGRAQISDNVDSSRRVVQCRPSTSLPVHGGAAVVCAKVAYDVPVLAVVEWRTARRFWTISTRRGAWCSVDHRCRSPCAVAPPPSAPSLPTMYQYSLLLFGGTSADVGQCRLVEARGAVSTIDVAARARSRRRRVR
jgi:hypothetical protein